MHHIVTSADTRFFSFAYRLMQTLHRLPNVRLFIYDLGLTDAERAAFAAIGVSVECVPVPADTFAMNSAQNIRTIHKLDCIEHFLRTYREGMILLDADTLVLDPAALDTLEPAFDEVVVTNRCRRDNKPHILINGKINCGVMAFGKDLPASFFKTWHAQCEDPEFTDQSALSLILDDNGVDWQDLNSSQRCCYVRVRILDGEIFNDTSCRVGQIFHFKSAGRRFSKLFWYYSFVLMLRVFPGLVRLLVRLNRRHGFLVWTPSSGKS